MFVTSPGQPTMGLIWSKQARRADKYKLSHDAAALNNKHQQQLSQASPSEGRKIKAKKGCLKDLNGQQGCRAISSATAPGSISTNTAQQARGPSASKKLDPKDFMFMNLQSSQQWKLPGSINGQQFVIDGCQGCDLYVLDVCAMVTIDDCQDCRIFIGPTESSVFIRNCRNCSFACITRQLRTRDCHNCQLLLLCRTRPIIESSSALAFGCLDTPYKGLAVQMAAAKLNPLHNFWSDVFDFTPPAVPQARANWSLLPAESSLTQLLGPFPEAVQLLMLSRWSRQCRAAQPQQVAGSSGAAVMSSHDEQEDNCNILQDCMAVLHTAGTMRQQPVGVCHSFLLFSAAQRAAALQCVLNHAMADGNTRFKTAVDIAAADNVAAAAAAAAESAAAESAARDGTNTSSCAAGHQWQHTLVHTNEAPAPTEVLNQMATAAAWSSSDLQKILMSATAAADNASGSTLSCNLGQKGSKPAAACFIGLEVMSADECASKQLLSAAAQLGALVTSSNKAATLFRNLGTDG